MRSRAAGLLLAGAALAGCASGSGGLPVTPRSLFDDYVMVRGVAAGRLYSRDLDRAEMLKIVELDHAALLALSGLADAPDDDAARARASRAIEALSDYAADAPPAPVATLVVRAP